VEQVLPGSRGLGEGGVGPNTFESISPHNEYKLDKGKRLVKGNTG
jgi:hypothetical protein